MDTPASFLCLSGELRNKIYEQVLVHHEKPIPLLTYPWGWQSTTLGLTPELLLANKTVHREASSLLYGQNRFNFAICTSEHVTCFFDQIGRNNANHIRHICIAFPNIRDLGRHDAALEDNDSVRILEKVQSDCTNLRTLTTSLYSTNAMVLELDALENPQIVVEAVALVDARFRVFSSLREVIVEVYEDGPSADVRKTMESHGWTIKCNKRWRLPSFTWWGCRKCADFQKMLQWERSNLSRSLTRK